jgi:elongation factor P
MISLSEIKKGNFIRHKGSIFKVEDISSRDGNYTSLELFSFLHGTKSVESFTSDHSFIEPELESGDFKLTARHDSSFVFYNSKTSEYLEMPVSILGENVKFLRDDADVVIRYCNGIVASIELPKIVVQEVHFTEDIEKDASNTEFVKEAKLANGRIITVPAFIKNGDRIKIHLDSGEYISRE